MRGSSSVRESSCYVRIQISRGQKKASEISKVLCQIFRHELGLALLHV